MAATVLPTYVRGTLRSFGSGEGNPHMLIILYTHDICSKVLNKYLLR